MGFEEGRQHSSFTELLVVSENQQNYAVRSGPVSAFYEVKPAIPPTHRAHRGDAMKASVELHA